MNLIDLLKKQERFREDYWRNVDYFLPIRLKWRAQMVRHFFHLFPENSILEVGAGSCQWTREISESNGNRNPICAAIFNKGLYEENNPFPENIERVHLDEFHSTDSKTTGLEASDDVSDEATSYGVGLHQNESFLQIFETADTSRTKTF